MKNILILIGLGIASYGTYIAYKYMQIEGLKLMSRDEQLKYFAKRNLDYTTQSIIDAKHVKPGTYN